MYYYGQGLHDYPRIYSYLLDRMEYLRPHGTDFTRMKASCLGFIAVLDKLNLV